MSRALVSLDRVQMITHLSWILGGKLLDVLRGDDVSIESVESGNVDGEPTTVINCRWQTVAQDTTVPWHSRYEFLPDEGWILRRCVTSSSWGDDEQSCIEIRLRYDAQHDGVPVIRQIIDEVAQGANHLIVQRIVTTITDVEFGPPVWPPIVSGIGD